jgi:hypothetical protein
MRTRAGPPQGDTAAAREAGLRDRGAEPIEPAGLLALQRTAGNRAATALVRSAQAPGPVLQRYLTENRQKIGKERAQEILDALDKPLSQARDRRFWAAVNSRSNCGDVNDFLAEPDDPMDADKPPPAVPRPRKRKQSTAESEEPAELEERPRKRLRKTDESPAAVSSSSVAPPKEPDEAMEIDEQGEVSKLLETATTAGGAKFERPVVVVAMLRVPRSVDRGPGTPVPLAYLRAIDEEPGEAEEEDRLLGFDGGHIIGLQIGGENVSWNVVPMYPAFNRGVWKLMEEETSAFVHTHRGAHRMTVALKYGGKDPEVPTQLTVTREQQDDDGSWNPSFASRTFSQPGDIVRTKALSEKDADALWAGLGDDELPAHIDHDEFDCGKLTFAAYVNKFHRLPRSRRGLYPDRPDDRPYQELDLYDMVNTVRGTGIKGARQGFTPVQRTMLLQANMAVNGGVLKSDDPDDPYPDLDERGTRNAPEIDNIVPESHGGSNHFSNARVVSWALNNKHDRVKSLVGIVDMTERSLPMVSTRNADERARTFAERALLHGVVGKGRSAIKAADISGWAAREFNENDTKKLRIAIERALAAMAAGGTLRAGRAGAYYRV